MRFWEGVCEKIGTLRDVVRLRGSMCLCERGLKPKSCGSNCVELSPRVTKRFKILVSTWKDLGLDTLNLINNDNN